MITKISPIRHRGPCSPITTQHLTLAPPRSLLVLGDDLQLLFHTAMRANPTRTNTHLILISRPLTVKRTVSPQAGTEGSCLRTSWTVGVSGHRGRLVSQDIVDGLARGWGLLVGFWLPT